MSGPDMSRYRIEDRGYSSPCWIWTGFVDARGYGKVQLNGTHTGAHRVSYLQAKGEIPNGLQIDHLCRQTNCINPDHLEPVTGQENMARRYALKTHCIHGHPLSGENLILEGGFRRCRACVRHRDRERDKVRTRKRVAAPESDRRRALSASDRVAICERRLSAPETYSISALARSFGVSRVTIHRVLNEQTRDAA
jgi:hypothetical protein